MNRSSLSLLLIIFLSLTSTEVFANFSNLPIPTTRSLEDATQAYKSGYYKEAFKIVRSLADKGDTEAQAWLGEMYGSGEGTSKDYSAAMKWFKVAAMKGNLRAKFNIGIMYHQAFLVSQDYEEAAKWYREAAEEGYPYAQFNLGVMLCNDIGLPPDDIEAYKWLSLAADSLPLGEVRNDAVRNLNILEKLMTPSQIAKAEELSTQWMSNAE